MLVVKNDLALPAEEKYGFESLFLTLLPLLFTIGLTENPHNLPSPLHFAMVATALLCGAGGCVMFYRSPRNARILSLLSLALFTPFCWHFFLYKPARALFSLTVGTFFVRNLFFRRFIPFTLK